MLTTLVKQSSSIFLQLIAINVIWRVEIYLLHVCLQQMFILHKDLTPYPYPLLILTKRQHSNGGTRGQTSVAMRQMRSTADQQKTCHLTIITDNLIQ